MATATQHTFSPMRGHVQDGVTVLCDDGVILTINSTMRGWKITSNKGEQIGETTNDASLVTHYVIGYGQ